MRETGSETVLDCYRLKGKPAYLDSLDDGDADDSLYWKMQR